MAITLANTGVIYPDNTKSTSAISQNINIRLNLGANSSIGAGNIVSVDSNMSIIGYPNTILTGTEVISSTFTYGNTYTLSADGSCGIYVRTDSWGPVWANIIVRGVGVGIDGTETYGANAAYMNTISISGPSASASLNNLNYWASANGVVYNITPLYSNNFLITTVVSTFSNVYTYQTTIKTGVFAVGTDGNILKITETALSNTNTGYTSANTLLYRSGMVLTSGRITPNVIVIGASKGNTHITQANAWTVSVVGGGSIISTMQNYYYPTSHAVLWSGYNDGFGNTGSFASQSNGNVVLSNTVPVAPTGINSTLQTKGNNFAILGEGGNIIYTLVHANGLFSNTSSNIALPTSSSNNNYGLGTAYYFIDQNNFVTVARSNTSSIKISSYTLFANAVYSGVVFSGVNAYVNSISTLTTSRLFPAPTAQKIFNTPSGSISIVSKNNTSYLVGISGYVGKDPLNTYIDECLTTFAFSTDSNYIIKGISVPTCSMATNTQKSLLSQTIRVMNPIRYISGNTFIVNYANLTGYIAITPLTVREYSSNLFNYFGISPETSSSNSANIIPYGTFSGFSELLSGNIYYLSDRYDGSITTFSNTGIVIGKATSPNTIILKNPY